MLKNLRDITAKAFNKIKACVSHAKKVISSIVFKSKEVLTLTMYPKARDALTSFLNLAKKVIHAIGKSGFVKGVKSLSFMEVIIIISGILSVAFFIVVQIFWNNWVETENFFELAYRFALADFSAILTFFFSGLIYAYKPS